MTRLSTAFWVSGIGSFGLLRRRSPACRTHLEPSLGPSLALLLFWKGDIFLLDYAMIPNLYFIYCLSACIFLTDILVIFITLPYQMCKRFSHQTTAVSLSIVACIFTIACLTNSANKGNRITRLVDNSFSSLYDYNDIAYHMPSVSIASTICTCLFAFVSLHSLS
jgi:hypothetical protein